MSVVWRNRLRIAGTKERVWGGIVSFRSDLIARCSD
jgi:hypothetical protein